MLKTVNLDGDKKIFDDQQELDDFIGLSAGLDGCTFNKKHYETVVIWCRINGKSDLLKFESGKDISYIDWATIAQIAIRI